MRKADYLPQPVKSKVSGCVFFAGEDDDDEPRKRRHIAE